MNKMPVHQSTLEAETFTITKDISKPCIKRQIDTENSAYAHSGIGFGLRKTGNPGTYYNIDKLKDIMLRERNQSPKGKYCMILEM